MPSTIGLGHAAGTLGRRTEYLSSEGSRRTETGDLVVPAELLARSGLDAPVDWLIESGPDGLRLAPDVLRKVYVEITSQCNLNCTTCIRQVWDEPLGHMPMERYQRMLAGLADPEPCANEPGNTGVWGSKRLTPPPVRPRGDAVTLSFGGYGEPLAHPDFLEMVRLAREQGLRVEVITNATLLDAAMARELVALGVAQVAVSIDGADESAYSSVRGGPLDPVTANVAALHRTRRRAHRPMTIGLAFVAMRRNIAGLPRLLRLAADLDVDFVSVSNVIPHTAEMADEALWNRTAWTTTSPRDRLRVIIAGMDLDETTRPALAAALGEGTARRSLTGDDNIRSNYCRFAHEGMLAVAWDGRVAPCLSLLHTHPEYVNEQWRTVEAYAVGCADEQSLAAIWRTPAYREFRHRVRAFDFSHCFACGGCLLTESNREDCYGNPFPACGECLWAQGLVLCP